MTNSFTLGQTVVEVQPSYRNGGESQVRHRTVTKVGRKWFYVDDHHHAGDHKFDLVSGLASYDPRRENGVYHPRIYSIEGWAEHQRRDRAEREWRRLGIQSTGFGRNPFTTDVLERVAAILGEQGARNDD